MTLRSLSCYNDKFEPIKYTSRGWPHFRRCRRAPLEKFICSDGYHRRFRNSGAVYQAKIPVDNDNAIKLNHNQSCVLEGTTLCLGYLFECILYFYCYILLLILPTLSLAEISRNGSLWRRLYFKIWEPQDFSQPRKDQENVAIPKDGECWCTSSCRFSP